MDSVLFFVYIRFLVVRLGVLVLILEYYCQQYTFRHLVTDSDLKSFIDNTLFVIVLYKCSAQESIAYQSLQRELIICPFNLYIYDNSPVSQELPESVIYYHHHSNAGVSTAYNSAFRKAKTLNKKWLLFFDQDTEIKKGTLNKYKEAILSHPEINVFVPVVTDHDKIVSPFQVLAGKGMSVKKIQFGFNALNKVCFINSGLCISLDTFERSGGYDERFPLDYSDIVFIERLALHNKYFFVINAELIHSLSSTNDKHADADDLLNRFEQYCLSSLLFKKISKRKVSLLLILLTRGLKLSVIKRDFRFVAVALKALCR